MPTLSQESNRKYELLERYRTERLEEVISELREQVEPEMAKDRFPWKGAFRHRDEIEQLYQLRRRWDRRFLFDLSAATAVVAVLVYGLSFVIKILAPF